MEAMPARLRADAQQRFSIPAPFDEPRWGALAAALAASGVAADAEALEALPFVIEVDADASAALRP
jgi:hypothetical protein